MKHEVIVATSQIQTSSNSYAFVGTELYTVNTDWFRKDTHVTKSALKTFSNFNTSNTLICFIFNMHVSLFTPLVAFLLSAVPAYAWDEYCNTNKTISVGCTDSSAIERDPSGTPFLAVRCEFQGNGKIQPGMVQTMYGENKLGRTQSIDDTKMFFEMKPGSEGQVVMYRVGEEKSGCEFKWGISYRYEKGQWKFVSKTVLPKGSKPKITKPQTSKPQVSKPALATK